MSDVCETFGFRVGYNQDVEETFGFQVGYGVNETFGFRVGYGRDVDETFGFRVGYQTPRQWAIQCLLANPELPYVTLPSGEVVRRSALKSLKYALKLELVDGGTVTEIPCAAFTITEPLNGAISWSATLGPDPDGWFIPHPSRGPFVGGLHRGGDVNDDGVKRYYRVEIRTAGAVWRRSHLIRNDHNWQLDDKRSTLTLIGTDLSERMVKCKDANYGPAPNVGDYKSRRGRVYTVQEIMGNILSKLQIRYRFEFADQPWAQFTAIGQAMGLLTGLIQQLQLEWFFDNDVFVVRDPKYLPGGPGRWHVTDAYQVRKASFRATGANVQTEAVREKVDQASNIAAEFDEEQWGILGYNTVQFDPPRTSITVDVLEAFNGSCPTFTYLDSNGNGIPGGTTTGSYVGPTPAHACRFLYLEDPDDPWPPGRKPKCHVVWYAANPLGLPEQFNQHYKQRYTDSEAKEEWGTCREPAQQTPELAFASQAQENAKRVVDSSQRFANVLNPECKLWPWIERGQTISLRLTAAGWLSPTYWYVESITKSVSSNNGTMALQMTRKARPDE